MATIKQKKAFKEMVENGSTKKAALIKAGYSENTAKAPTKVTNSDGWQELLQKHIPDSKLAKVLDEGLKAVTEKGLEDYSVRHKYLETGLRIKGKNPKEDSPTIALQVNLTQVIEKVNTILDA